MTVDEFTAVLDGWGDAEWDRLLAGVTGNGVGDHEWDAAWESALGVRGVSRVLAIADRVPRRLSAKERAAVVGAAAALAAGTELEAGARELLLNPVRGAVPGLPAPRRAEPAAQEHWWRWAVLHCPFRNARAAAA